MNGTETIHFYKEKVFYPPGDLCEGELFVKKQQSNTVVSKLQTFTVCQRKAMKCS